MKNSIYFFILLTPFIALSGDAYKDELYYQEYLASRINAIEQWLNTQQPQTNNHHRKEFISFVRNNHQIINNSHLIKQLLRLSAPELKYFFDKYNWSEHKILHCKQLYLSQEFIKILDEWEEKVINANPRPKEVIIKQDGDQFFIETKN